MRILQVVTSLNLGGAENVVARLSAELRMRGFEVDVAVFNRRNAFLENAVRAAGCGIFFLGRSFYNPLYVFRLARLMGKYDVVHAHNTASQYFVILASLLLKKRFCLCTTEHSVSNRRRKWKCLRRIERWMYEHYDRVVCVSELSRKELSAFLGESKIVFRCIPNGVDVQSFSKASPATDVPPHSGKIVIAMVAGFRLEKDQDTLLRALALLPRDAFSVWLIGDGERREVLARLAREDSVESETFFLGVRGDIERVLKCVDIFVMSSHFEGHPLSCLEAMAAGVPIVASDVPGLKEMIGGVGRLFAHESAQELADILSDLRRHPEERKILADKGEKYVEEQSTSHMVDSYERLFRSLIESGA